MEAVRLDLDTASTDIVAELDEGLGCFDRLGDHGRVGVVIALIAADADHGHRAVSEALPDLFSLRCVERGLDLVGMRAPELDPENLARGAVADQGRKIPVLSPEVGDEAELHRRARLGQRASQQSCR